MIAVFFECDVCGEEAEIDAEEFGALHHMLPPKGWIYINERGYCDGCKKYSGVIMGANE